MRRHLLVALTAGLALAFTASLARATCDFEHPTKARSFMGHFVQAFVSCGNPGGNSPNTFNESGSVPTCAPPETFNQQANPPLGLASGWRWDEVNSIGRVRFSALKFGPSNILNPPGDTVDLKVVVRLRGVIDNGGFATGSGFLATLARATINDRKPDGPGTTSMTVVDFPVNFPISLSGGKATLKTTADAQLNALGLSGLPPCTSIEIVDLLISDENGNVFANVGLYLPEL